MQDPKFKFNILEAIMKYLYVPVAERHGKQLESLILRNVLMMNAGVRAFRYKGELYRSSQTPRGPVMAPKLHEDLAPELDELHREKEEIRSVEEPMIKGFITTVLNQSTNIDDYLLMLPSCVHQPVLDLNGISYGPRLFPTPAHAALLLEKHARSIALIKERMATNLLFQ